MSFSYTIDKETFIDSINSIIDLHNFIDKLYKDGIEIKDNFFLDIETRFVDLLCKCCNDRVLSEENNEYMSDIGYFLYELEDGKNWKEDCFTIDGKDIDFHSPEKLWEYIEKYNLKVDNK